MIQKSGSIDWWTIDRFSSRSLVEVYSRLTQPQYGLNPKMSEKMNHPGRTYSPYQQLSASVVYQLIKVIIINTQNFAWVNYPYLFAFSFCQNPGLALPLIALQYNEVVLRMEFNPLTDFL